MDNFLKTGQAKRITDQYEEWKVQRIKEPGWFPIFNEFVDDDLLKKLSGNGLKLYIYLGIHSKNDTGVSWHSIKTIAKYFGKSERTISTWIEELIKNGLIERIQPERTSSSVTFLKPYGRRNENDKENTNID